MQKLKFKDDPKSADKKKTATKFKNGSTQAHENHRRSYSNEKLQEKQPRTNHSKLQKQGKDMIMIGSTYYLHELL